MASKFGASVRGIKREITPVNGGKREENTLSNG